MRGCISRDLGGVTDKVSTTPVYAMKNTHCSLLKIENLAWFSCKVVQHLVFLPVPYAMCCLSINVFYEGLTHQFTWYKDLRGVDEFIRGHSSLLFNNNSSSWFPFRCLQCALSIYSISNQFTKFPLGMLSLPVSSLQKVLRGQKVHGIVKFFKLFLF